MARHSDGTVLYNNLRYFNEQRTATLLKDYGVVQSESSLQRQHCVDLVVHTSSTESGLPCAEPPSYIIAELLPPKSRN